MSFSMTTVQFRDQTKTVTRRFGWWFLRPGDILMGVVQAQGLRRGQRVERLGLIRVLSTRPEPLDAITPAELVLEGLPGMRPKAFMDMMMQGRWRGPGEPVNRIQYEYLDQGEANGSQDR